MASRRWILALAAATALLVLGGCSGDPQASTAKAAKAESMKPDGSLEALVATTPAFRNLGKRAEGAPKSG